MVEHIELYSNNLYTKIAKVKTTDYRIDFQTKIFEKTETGLNNYGFMVNSKQNSLFFK